MPGTLRLVAPFDPIVWDWRGFALLWGWPYKFEVYTPKPERKLGYYALPLLWREQAIGWANVRNTPEGRRADFGYAAGRAPRDAALKRALDAEPERPRVLLAVDVD